MSICQTEFVDSGCSWLVQSNILRRRQANLAWWPTGHGKLSSECHVVGGRHIGAEAVNFLPPLPSQVDEHCRNDEECKTKSADQSDGERTPCVARGAVIWSARYRRCVFQCFQLVLNVLPHFLFVAQLLFWSANVPFQRCVCRLKLDDVFSQHCHCLVWCESFGGLLSCLESVRVLCSLKCLRCWWFSAYRSWGWWTLCCFNSCGGLRCLDCCCVSSFHLSRGFGCHGHCQTRLAQCCCGRVRGRRGYQLCLALLELSLERL